jgi:autotransporter-associated beta strand protein
MIDQGRVDFTSAAAIGGGGSGGNSIRIGNNVSSGLGTLRYTGTGDVEIGRRVQIGNGANVNQTGSAIIENMSATGRLVFTNSIFNADGADPLGFGNLNTAATRTLTLGGSSTLSNEIAGRIIDNSTATGGTIGVIKEGAGRWVLSGSNSYTGATTVNAGSLIINGDQSAATGVLTVAANATLGGSGTIGGATTISGIHSPGNSAGVQTFSSNLTYSGPGAPTVEWELTANTTTQASPTPVFDQIVVNGNLNFAVPTTLTLNFALAESTVDWSDGLWANNITGTSGWLVYDVVGTLSNFQNLSISVEDWADRDNVLLQSVRAGSSFSLYNDGISGDVYLNYAVPEPSTYALLALAAAGLGAHVVRRRRSAR